MQRLLGLAIFVIALQNTSAYSKYGRTCKDIGCLNNEVCVMEEDPCSYYNRDQCGKYPTCKPSGDSSGPSCARFVCPPTMQCHMDNGTPKCIAKSSSSSRVIPVHSESDRPSAPQPDSIYPKIPPQQPAYPQGGYSGGAPNSGYPGYSGGQPGSGYPGGQPGSGYPGGRPGSAYPGGQPGGGYPSQQYPGYGGQNGYNNRGSYPYNNQGGYSGYPSQGQHGQYPGYGQYGNRGSSSQNSGSNPLVDKLTNQLKSIGLICVLFNYLTLRLFV